MKLSTYLILSALIISANANATQQLVVTDDEGHRTIIKTEATNPEAEAARLSALTGQSVDVDIVVTTPDNKPESVQTGYVYKTSSISVKEQGKSAEYEPNDTYYSAQYYWGKYSESTPHYNNILNSVRHLTPLRQPVIGVADSGFWAHPDIPYLDGYGFNTTAGEREERYFINEEQADTIEGREACSVHGTGVASVTSAIRDNNYGIAGISDSNVLASKTMNCGSGVLSDTADSVTWMAGGDIDGIRAPVQTADVINLSLGGQASECPSFFQDAINTAKAASVPVIVAVGNAQVDTANFIPANCNNVIVVAAASENGGLYDSSNTGTGIDIAASGDMVAGLLADPDAIGWYTESSFATPVVTATVGNAIAEFGALSIAELEFFMQATSNAFTADECQDANVCGIGILDADAFHEAVRSYRSKEVLALTPALNNTEFCDKTLYATDNDELARLCAITEVTLPVIAESQDDVYFEILSFPKGDAMLVSGGTPVMTTSENKGLISDVDTDSFDYGVRVCTSERCFGDEAIALTDNTADAPEACQ